MAEKALEQVKLDGRDACGKQVHFQTTLDFETRIEQTAADLWKRIALEYKESVGLSSIFFQGG